MKQQPAITPASGRYFLTDLIREEVTFWLTGQNQGVEPLQCSRRHRLIAPVGKVAQP